MKEKHFKPSKKRSNLPGKNRHGSLNGSRNGNPHAKPPGKFEGKAQEKFQGKSQGKAQGRFQEKPQTTQDLHYPKDSLIGGFHPVNELISKTGFYSDDELLLARSHDDRISHLLQKAKKADVNIRYVTFDELSRLLGQEHHQGIVLYRSHSISFPELTTEDMEKGGVFVVLESLQDPGNLGTIIRSVAAFGANGLVLSKHETAPLGQSALKSSAGALLHVPVLQTGRIASFLQNYTKDPAVCIIGSTMDGELLNRQSLSELRDLYKTIFLVFGSEENGLSRLVKERCHHVFKIPQTDTIQSLNVAQAVSVFLYEFCGKYLS